MLTAVHENKNVKPDSTVKFYIVSSAFKSLSICIITYSCNVTSKMSNIIRKCLSKKDFVNYNNDLMEVSEYITQSCYLFREHTKSILSHLWHLYE